MSITLIANLSLAFSQWVLIASLNYSGNLEVVGQYSYALALAGIFLTIGQMGLRQFLMSNSVEPDHLEQLFVTRLFTSILTWCLLVLYALLIVDNVYFWPILLLGLAKVAENMSDLAHGFYQKNFQVLYIVRSRLARSILTPCIFLSVFFITQNLNYAFLAMLLTWGLVFMIFDKGAFSTKQRRLYCVNLVPDILSKAYPMGVTSVLVLLSVSMPLFFLANIFDAVQVGQYASVFYFATAGSLVLQSALQVISPIIVAHLNNRTYSKISTITRNCYLLAVVYGLVGIVLAIFLGEWVLQLVYGEGYIGLGNLMVLAAIINLVLAIQAVGGIVLTAHGVFKFQMVIISISVLISVVGGYFFIVNYGVFGAFFAGILTVTFNGICFGLRVAKELQKNEKNTCTTYYK